MKLNMKKLRKACPGLKKFSPNGTTDYSVVRDMLASAGIKPDHKLVWAVINEFKQSQEFEMSAEDFFS